MIACGLELAVERDAQRGKVQLAVHASELLGGFVQLVE
jgi:hypothetical protein